MQKKHLVVILLLLIGLAGSLTVWADGRLAGMPASPGIHVIETDAQSITVEYVAGALSHQTIARNGETFDLLALANTVQQVVPGQLQLPIASASIGIPNDANLTLTLLSVESEPLAGPVQLPVTAADVSTRELPDNLFDLDSEGIEMLERSSQELEQRLARAETAIGPSNPAELGPQSRLGNQAIVPLRFFPITVQPDGDYAAATGVATFHSRIRVRVEWRSNNVQAAAQPASQSERSSPYFESVLRDTILNYSQLDRTVNPPNVLEEADSPVVVAAGLNATSVSTQTLKVWTDKAGFHLLTYTDLDSVGFDLSRNPQNLLLENQGQEVAIWIEGQADGSFDEGDQIIFYAEEHDTDYSGENVYWLRAGDAAGLRMPVLDRTPTGAAAGPDYFRQTLHFEENTNYWQTMPDGEGKDHWFWDGRLTAPISKTESITVTNLVSGTDAAGLLAELRVGLKGRTDTDMDPDHHTQIWLNDTLIDDQFWDGFAHYIHSTTVSQTLLVDGPNSLRLESVGDTGSAVDQIFLNWIEVDAWRSLEADDDQLVFELGEDGPYDLTVRDFNSGQVYLFEGTNPRQLSRIVNATVDTGPAGISARFAHTSSAISRYYALSDDQLHSPLRMALDEPSALRNSSNGADYILITPPELMLNTLPLATFREGQGLRVKVVSTTDIYDEFSHGFFTPQALRDFLTYAYQNWTAPAPAYVLFVGDATLDYRDRLGTGSVNFVPTQLIETDLLGQTPSDNWFVQLDETDGVRDILPDMFIGRLSAQTAEQVETIVQKLIDYETTPPDESWSSNVLFVADDKSPSFTGTSDSLAALLPVTSTVSQINIETYVDGDDPAGDINVQINDGAFLTNYTGHGAVTRWGKWGDNQVIYNNDDVDALTNGDKLTILTAANCLNGFFAGFQTSESIAERFQRLPDGGAVAAWAPSNLFYSSAHRVLLQEFYRELYQKRTVTLGAATTNAKVSTYAQSSGWDELVTAFILFGDPATSLDATLPQLPVTPTPDDTPTNAPTKTPTSAATPVPSETPDGSPTDLPLPSPTGEMSATPDNTPEPSSTPDGSATPAVTDSETPMPTGSPTEAETPLPTADASPTGIPTVPTVPPISEATPTGEESESAIFLPFTASGQ